MKFLKINSIEKRDYNGKIYDLEVKNSHTYNINNIIVGNCSGGLHGVGTKCVNALSDMFKVTVKRDGKIYHQEFCQGNPTTGVDVIGTCDINDTGTIIEYHPDKEIFKITLEPNDKDIQNRIDELASLNAGIKVNYINEITGFEKTYYYEDGIIGYTKRLIENVTPLFENPFYLKGNYEIPNSDGRIIMVETSFIYDDEEKASETIKTFANNINTYEGGFHLQGFRNEYRKQMNDIASTNKWSNSNIELKYLLDGIHAVVSVKVPECEFEGQTKTKLGNAEVQDAVEYVIREQFKEIIKNKELMSIIENIITRAVRVKEAEEAARKARANARKINKTSKLALPGKLADCGNKNGYTELFVVEGDSAAGSAKSGRYREFQAILPLRGKILNTEKADIERMMKSEAIQNIIAAMGTGIGAKFDIKKSRYDKLIIMADADVDGAHITILILTLIYNYMRPLLENEMVYITMPPLYKVVKNKKVIYLRDDHELKEFKKKHGSDIDVQRFKGLGEMSYQQLKETTMDPKNRTLKKVTLDEAERVAQAINTCMGNDSNIRRQFIEDNAYKVQLDI